ncbi:MAG: 16S rRNA (guanine(527)-N(7))-methyltransferase RsmG [Candidatus Izemoplasmataceae bacterium]
MMKDFLELLNNDKIEYDQDMLDKFEIYYETLIEWNKKMNLTAITDKEEVYKKHFYDSLCLAKALPMKNQTLLDVGSGAGFPSIPLKIIYPNLKVTIVDSLKKRIGFLENLIDKIGVDITLIHSRIEDFELKESFDIVTARAVANLTILTEFCMPFVKVNGYFLPLKSKSLNEELSQALQAIKILGGKYIKTIDYSYNNLERYIVMINKKKESPKKYPRDFSKIKKQPL